MIESKNILWYKEAHQAVARAHRSDGLPRLQVLEHDVPNPETRFEGDRPQRVVVRESPRCLALHHAEQRHFAALERVYPVHLDRHGLHEIEKQGHRQS